MTNEARETINQNNAPLIAGLDEVGMGSLVGDVVVVVAAFPKDKVRLAGVRDSKKCSAQQIADLTPIIVSAASFLNIGFATVEAINIYGIADAWQKAAAMALEDAPEFLELVVDGTRAVDNYSGKQRVQPKADTTDWQVSAASIVAKHVRDQHMKTLAGHYEGYGWETNAGYGSAIHLAAIKAMGPTPLHREKYIRKVLNKTQSRFTVVR